LKTDNTNILELPVREAISYVFDDFRLDVKRQELQKSGHVVPLTHKAYRVLLILVQNSEQTVEKEYIYKELWGDSFVEDANLTQHIYILRKTLGQTSIGESYIETVSRTGYRFTVPVRAVYPPQIAEAFFKPKTGAELAPERQPEARHEPHLRLADLPAVNDEERDDFAAEVEQVEKESAIAMPSAKRRTIILVAAIVAAVLLIGLAVYFRTRTTAVSPQPIRSVAVLPFKPIGDESKNEKLGLGMADAIITNLSKLRQIPVRPTSSVVRYIDTPEPNSVAAGSELGVDTVLEGTVQLADERVRVSVQLIDVNGGKPIWAQNFDEPYTNVFAVQDSISQKVVRYVAANLSQRQPDAARSGTTSNVEAMTAYQVGVYLHSTRTKDNLFKAESYFLEAIKHDPQFAKAYAMLADTYNMQRYYGYADPRETRAKGLDAASRALELDNSTPEAYIAMANLQFGGKEGVAGAKRMLEKAIELSPFNSTAHLRYAWVVLASGDEKGAVEQMRLAQEYDPVSPISNGAYCNMLSFERRFKEAITYCEKALELNAGSENGTMMLADMYLFDGRTNEAISLVQKRLAQVTGDDNIMAQATLAFYFIRAGRRAEAEPIIAKLEAEAHRMPGLYNDLTVIFYELGEREKGLRYFKRAYEERVLPVQMVRYYPVWEKVIADAQVRAILDEPQTPQSNSNSSSNGNRSSATS
jgi:TolB-like protein/DNA-binding winged helix-turn-helix (wHTH) protein/tetratricopeptide (TPR) repeat protein